MSGQRLFKWRSGRLASTPINDGWAIDLDSRDPSIPNLPLEGSTPAAVGFRSLLAKGVSGAGAGSLAYSLAAGQGDYSLSGQAASLVATRTLAAGQGSYGLTGQTVGLPATRLLVAGQGSYTLFGQDVSLLSTRAVAAEQGSYALNGQSVGFLSARLLVAVQGSYALSGQDTALAWSGGSGPVGFLSLFGKNLGGAGALSIVYTLTADCGYYNVIGSDALADFQITLAPGAYALSGQDVTLQPSAASAVVGFNSLFAKNVSGAGVENQHIVLSAGQGSYALTGQDVSLWATRTLAAAQGSYALSGVSATLNYSADGPTVGFTSLLAKSVSGAGRPLGAYSLPADYGSYSLIGSDALSDFAITLETGSYALTGQAVALTYAAALVLIADTGSYTLSGQPVTLTSTGTPVIPPSTGGGIGGGGGGRHRGWDEVEARRKRKKDQELEASIRRIYRDLTEEPATAELAGEIVEPIAKTTAAVPKVRDVAFERATVEIELALRMLHAEMDALRAEEAELAEVLEILELID